MFGIKKAKDRSAEVRDLSDDLKRKISEVHLRIRTGELTSEELANAKKELCLMRERLETRLVRASADAIRPSQA